VGSEEPTRRAADLDGRRLECEAASVSIVAARTINLIDKIR
jgi:hypothetical protein